MYFDSSVISQNSEDFHLSQSFPLTAHLSVTNWKQSSRLSVFPTIPSPFCTAILLSSSLLLLLKVQHPSPSYIRNSFQHPSHPLSNHCSFSRLLKYVSAFPSGLHFPPHPPTSLIPPLSSLSFLSHLSLFCSPLCHSHRALH